MADGLYRNGPVFGGGGDSGGPSLFAFFANRVGLFNRRESSLTRRCVGASSLEYIRRYASVTVAKNPALSHRTRKGQGTQVSESVGQFRLHQAMLSLIASLNCSTAPIICSEVMMAGGAITK
jgi:hypothetical protein